MTAKEYLKDKWVDANSPSPQVIKYMEEYARIKCKEQRDVIIDSFYTKPFGAQAQRIVQETPLVI